MQVIKKKYTVGRIVLSIEAKETAETDMAIVLNLGEHRVCLSPYAKGLL